MMKALGKTALWLAMAAVAANGHLYAQGAAEAPLVGTYQDAGATAQPVFSVQQVEQMVAPVALYPDSLLAQVLMASTYPIEVAQAHQWLQKNRDLSDQALDDAVAAQPWDPSVKTLVFFPDVLERLAQDLAWTQDLGDAFLSQEADVMGAVQRLRRQAQDAGNLASNSQQVVRTQGSTIVVEPADPTVVYVPSYNPATAYGSSWAPTTSYYPTTYGYSSSFPTWVVFGAGVLVGAILTAAIDWADDDDYYVVYPRYRRYRHHHIHHVYYGYWDRDWDGPRYGRPGWRSYRPVYLSRGDVYIDKSKTINVTNQYNTFVKREWSHNPVHRRSVSYRDPEVARRFVETQNVRRADGEGVGLPDAGGAQRLDRDTLRRLDRNQPAALPSDKATREALQGDPRERRERILRGQPEGRPLGSGAETIEDVAPRRFPGRDPERKGLNGAELSRPEGAMRQLERRGGPEAQPGALARPEAAAKTQSPRQWQQRGEPVQSPEVFERPAMQRRTEPRQLQEAAPGQIPSDVEPRVEPRRVPQAAERQEAERQLQQRVEPRQFQQRAEPRPAPQVAAPQESPRRMESRQFQQRAEPRPAPQVAAPQEAPRRMESRQFQQRAEPRPAPQVAAPQQAPRRIESRQFQQRAEPRPAPQVAAPQEAPRQKSGGQAAEQRLRKRDDDGN